MVDQIVTIKWICICTIAPHHSLARFLVDFLGCEQYMHNSYNKESWFDDSIVYHHNQNKEFCDHCTTYNPVGCDQHECDRVGRCMCDETQCLCMRQDVHNLHNKESWLDDSIIYRHNQNKALFDHCTTCRPVECDRHECDRVGRCMCDETQCLCIG